MSVLEKTKRRAEHWAVIVDGDDGGRMFSSEFIAVQVAELWASEGHTALVEKRPGAWIPPSMRNRRPLVYAEYIQSPNWKAKAAEAKRNAGYRCQLCNKAGNLDAHHRTYERLGFELSGDITVLCNACHEKHHEVMQTA